MAPPTLTSTLPDPAAAEGHRPMNYRPVCEGCGEPLPCTRMLELRGTPASVDARRTSAIRWREDDLDRTTPWRQLHVDLTQALSQIDPIGDTGRSYLSATGGQGFPFGDLGRLRGALGRALEDVEQRWHEIRRELADRPLELRDSLVAEGKTHCPICRVEIDGIVSDCRGQPGWGEHEPIFRPGASQIQL
ncbi:MAG TPA: hypothetical protein VLF21_03265 [Candidatus Saccharimonadales bacterium]|nr:hypothetical protein [Candidatus Saccharimonadales bacterium]